MPLPSFPSRFRRAAALALTASAMFGTQVAAFAQDEPPDDGDDTVEIVGWDLSDPVNHAESREFFAGLWAAQDAGLPPPAFECDPGPYLPDLDTLRGCNVRWFMPPAWPERPGGVPGPEWTPPAWPGPGLPCGYPESP